MMIILETDRLVLRKMNPGDYFDLCNIMKDPQVMYAYEGAFSDNEIRQWLGRQLERYENYGFGLWAVILKDTREFIGQCGITMQEYKGSQVPEIGYLFNKRFWHRGYATEAATACKDYAFRKLGMDSIYSIIRDSNAASQNVALRNGMNAVDKIIKHYRDMDMPHIVFVVRKQLPGSENVKTSLQLT